MRRLLIFSFYNSQGIVDEYVEYLIEQLTLYAERIVIVVNGEIDICGKKLFEKYSNEIVIRKNLGFDAGAYKDVLNSYIRDELWNYDELILCNNTFFGVLDSISTIFDKMKKSKADFWGINYVENNIANHLQSYFLVFRNKNKCFELMLLYMNKYINSINPRIEEISPVFEIGLFMFLVKEYNLSWDYYVSTNADIYTNIFGCIKNGLPIIKKKAFKYIDTYYDNIISSLYYIEHKTNYNVDYILKNVNREYGCDIFKRDIINSKTDVLLTRNAYMAVYKQTADDVIEFVKRGKYSYIYGYKTWLSKIIYWSSIRLVGNFKGYIVSDDQIIDEIDVFGYPIYRFSEVENIEESRIVVSLGKKNMKIVKEQLGEKENIMYIISN